MRRGLHGLVTQTLNSDSAGGKGKYQFHFLHIKGAIQPRFISLEESGGVLILHVLLFIIANQWF